MFDSFLLAHFHFLFLHFFSHTSSKTFFPLHFIFKTFLLHFFPSQHLLLSLSILDQEPSFVF